MSRYHLVALSLLLLAGCATTGDPRKGGMFGWSREKADARLASLEAQNASEERHAAFAQRRSEELGDRKDNLDDEAARLRAEIDSLMSENLVLESRLRKLMIDRTLDEAETSRLQALLAQNAALHEAAVAPSAQPVQEAGRADAIHQQNGRLHREVMALLRR